MDIKTIDDYVLMVLSEGRKWNPDDELAPHNCKTMEEFVVKNLVAAEEKVAQLEEELQEKDKQYQMIRGLSKTIRTMDEKEIRRLKERVAFLEREVEFGAELKILEREAELKKQGYEWF